MPLFIFTAKIYIDNKIDALDLSKYLHIGTTIHLNTVQYLPEIFQFVIDTYEIRPFNWFTITQTDGFDWDKDHLELFE